MSPLWTIIIDSAAWAVIHMSISYGGFQLSERLFVKDTWLYKERGWERRGQLYERIGIKKWKAFVPDGASLFRTGFQKKQLQRAEYNYLSLFYLETKRAECIHWLLIPPAFLFFLWNERSVGFVMIIYALCFNLPLIMVQRYNRIRLRRVLKSIRRPASVQSHNGKS